MDEQAQKIMKAQLAKLPAEVQRIIASADLSARLITIARDHHLRVDEGAVVENETMLVLLGLEHPREYISNLKKELRMPTEAVEAVARDVDSQIFAPVRESLISLHKDAPPDTIPTAPTPTQPSSASVPVPLVPPSRTLGSDIAQIKLSGNVHLPSDAVKMKETPTVSMPSGTQKPPSPVQGGTYTRGSDPYREPTQ